MHIKPGMTRWVGGAGAADRERLRADDHVPGERVWCVENRLGSLVIRRRGKVSVVGNCVGRVLRPAQGKDRALLIDLVGGVHQHGLADDERIWSLDGEPHRLADRAMALSQCPSCGAVWRSNGKPCPVCGFELPPPPPPKIDERPLEDLRARLRPALITNASPEKRDAKWSELVALGRERGYKDGWAKMRYKAIFGKWRSE